MPQIIAITQIQHMPTVVQVNMACGHKVLRAQDNPTLEVRNVVICEPCLMASRFPEVFTITLAHDMKMARVDLKCGHALTIHLGAGIFTANNVHTLVGTNMQCNQCTYAQR